MAETSVSMAIVNKLVAGWEALDGDAVAACFTEDGVWHNMPYPPTAGREKIRAAVSGFVGTMKSARFEIIHAGEISPGVVMNERVDVFVRPNGSELRFPVMGVFEIRDGLIHQWRDYFDGAVMNQG